MSPPQLSDIQRVQTYFTNISLIGSYDQRVGGNVSGGDKNANADDKL